MTEHFANEAQTTLTAELVKEATTLTVASATRFPTEGNFLIRIDSELRGRLRKRQINERRRT